VSEYNAWRLFGMLAFMLKIPLAENVQKAIVFSDGTESPCPVRPPVDGEMLFALVKQVSGFAGDDHDVVGLVGHVQKISKAGGTVP
jgi:hypothetical protein